MPGLRQRLGLQRLGCHPHRQVAALLQGSVVIPSVGNLVLGFRNLVTARFVMLVWHAGSRQRGCLYTPTPAGRSNLTYAPKPRRTVSVKSWSQALASPTGCVSSAFDNGFSISILFLKSKHYSANNRCKNHCQTKSNLKQHRTFFGLSEYINKV